MQPLVGRMAELDQTLDGVLRVAVTGLAAVMVSGEAGIGKSRLLAEAATRLDRLGWRTLRLSADRLERRVPYAALASSVRALGTDNTFTEGLRREAALALDPYAVDAPAVPEGALFGRACAAMTRLLTALAAAGPVALLVDDLPDLDDDCLALFAVVLRRLAAAPIGLIATARSHLAEPNPAADDLIQRLGDELDLLRIEVGTLTPAELAEVTAPTIGAPPDAGLAAELHRRSDGNPFFAIAVAASLAEAGLITLEAGTARLASGPGRAPLTRRDAVLRRVLPLGAPARAVARALAVLRKLDIGQMRLVADVVSLSEPVVAAAFDDLVRARIVEQVDQRRYRFTHDLVAAALYAEIGPAERRHLHRLAALWLRAERHRGGPVDLLELARHAAESAVPGEDWAVAVLADAAKAVLASAPEAAAGFCERALTLLGPAAPDRAGLLGLRCRALARASLPADAVRSGLAALALLPPGEERHRVAIAVVNSLFLLDRIDEAIEVAEAQVAAGPAPAALHAQRALMLVFAGRTREAVAAETVAASTVATSPAEEVVVCGQLAMLTSMLARHTETVAYADRALRAGGDSATLRQQALAVGASTGALAGLVSDASARLRLAERIAEEAGTPPLFPGELGLTRVVLDWLGGRWEAALDGLRTVSADLAVRQQATLAVALTAVELEIRTWRGELARGAQLAAHPMPTLPNMADLHAWALAAFQAASGSSASAGATLRTALAKPDSHPDAVVPYGSLLLSRLIELDPQQETDALVKALVEVASPHVSPWSRSVLHRTVGVATGDRSALEEAVAEAGSGGLVFERARAQLALGELVPDEVPALMEAHRIFDRLGAHGLSRRAGRRLHELGAKVPRRRQRAAGLLTESEERVARLVQQGMRNREIAGALHYSPRSVEVYLSRVYAKLRVASRLELARMLDAIDAGGVGARTGDE